MTGRAPDRPAPALRGLILDFDGVVADSEILANAVLADAVSALGHPTTLDQSLARYMGKRAADIVATIEGEIGRPLPAGFMAGLDAATFARFRRELREVPGAGAFLRRFAAMPRCIASSSSLARLRLCLDVLGLAGAFGENVLSADLVAEGKPAPDLFLLAARRMGVAPQACLVVEDGVGGVRAGIAAGMTVVGLCAGSHSRPGHAERLRQAGARHIAASWAEVSTLLASLSGEG